MVLYRYTVRLIKKITTFSTVLNSLDSTNPIVIHDHYKELQKTNNLPPVLLWISTEAEKQQSYTSLNELHEIAIENKYPSPAKWYVHYRASNLKHVIKHSVCLLLAGKLLLC